MSSIAGQTLFDSGPHRFALKPVGMLFVPPLFFDPIQTTTNVVTQLEVAIVQSGRLTAATAASVWAQVELIRAAAEAQLTGDLIDQHGVVRPGMTLLRFDPASHLDVGRVVSLAYEARYIRLA